MCPIPSNLISNWILCQLHFLKRYIIFKNFSATQIYVFIWRGFPLSNSSLWRIEIVYFSNLFDFQQVLAITVSRRKQKEPPNNYIRKFWTNEITLALSWLVQSGQMFPCFNGKYYGSLALDPCKNNNKIWGSDSTDSANLWGCGRGGSLGEGYNFDVIKTQLQRSVFEFLIKKQHVAK